MSEIDDLEDMMRGTAFGHREGFIRGLKQHTHMTEFCGNNHLWTDASTRWYRDKNTKRLRRICRICDKARRIPKCSAI